MRSRYDILFYSLGLYVTFMWITFNKSLAGIPLERIILSVNNAIMKDVQTQPVWKRVSENQLMEKLQLLELIYLERKQI